MSEDDSEGFDLSIDDPDEDDADPDARAAEDLDPPHANADDDAPPEDGDEDPFADIEGVDVEDDPFSDFDVGDGPEADESAANSLFTEREISDLDDDEVWSQLADEEQASKQTEPESAVTEPEAADTTGEERVVEKRAYCEQCEYFSEPPDVACTYPTSEIVELVDTERFRVRNCPIVARRENSEITAIAGGGDDPELEPGDPTATADPEPDD